MGLRLCPPSPPAAEAENPSSVSETTDNPPSDGQNTMLGADPQQEGPGTMLTADPQQEGPDTGSRPTETFPAEASPVTYAESPFACLQDHCRCTNFQFWVPGISIIQVIRNGHRDLLSVPCLNCGHIAYDHIRLEIWLAPANPSYSGAQGPEQDDTTPDDGTVALADGSSVAASEEGTVALSEDEGRLE